MYLQSIDKIFHDLLYIYVSKKRGNVISYDLEGFMFMITDLSVQYSVVSIAPHVRE